MTEIQERRFAAMTATFALEGEQLKARIRHFNQQSGLSMVSLLVVVSMLTGIGFIFSTMYENSIKVSSSVEKKFELAAIKQLINNSLDCNKSLGITTGTRLPLVCAAYRNVSIKNKFGKDIYPNSHAGPWTISAACEGNHVIVRASRSGNDPVTAKPYSSLPEASDLFEGVSRFCINHFTTQTLGDYGGLYQKFRNVSGTDYGCRLSNYLTGSCVCANGTHPVLISEMTSLYNGSCSFYSDSSGACGYAAYLCVRR